MKVKEYFTDGEVLCRCGCGMIPDVDSLERLYAIRIILGIPLKVNSGARCQAHNEIVGGTVESFHLQGKAFDLDIKDISMRGIVAELALKCGFTGVGFSKTFLHVDTGHRKVTLWTY